MRHTFNMLFLIVFITSCKQFSQKSETTLAMVSEIPKTTKSVVFIAGFDEGKNTYYTNAKAYFNDKDVLLIEGLFSIEEIIKWLNKNIDSKKSYDEINIVSHSNQWLGMSLKTAKDGERITVKTLQEARKKNKIPKIVKGITKETKIIFHACGLGENLELLSTLQQVFTINHRPQPKGMKSASENIFSSDGYQNRDIKHTGGNLSTNNQLNNNTIDHQPKVYASSYFNIFGGKYAAHYLAKPYYNFYPTAESPGPTVLSKEFSSKYANTQIDWFTALKTRRETTLGAIYSYKFNIPVDWEFTFDKQSDIPDLKDKEAIMDWVSESDMAETLYRLNIPLEKYRWKSKIQGNTLIIKGKTTVLCVLQPILDGKDPNEYRSTFLEDSYLYQIL